MRKNKYKKVSFVLSCGLTVILGFLFFQGYMFYQIKGENDRLIALKDEYLVLCEDIENYKLLINQYEIVLSESNDLQSNREGLEKKISDLNTEIKNLESKITDVNKKIKNLS